MRMEGLSARTCSEKEIGNVEKLNSLVARSWLAISAMRDREEGQALVEYALLLSLIAVASIGILQAVGLSVASIFSSVNNQL
jgi:Flp pilus assembly pilin Flp